VFAQESQNENTLKLSILRRNVAKNTQIPREIDVIGFLCFFYENLVCNLQKLFDNSRFVLQQSSGEIPQSTL